MFERGLSFGLVRPTMNDLLTFFDTVGAARKINQHETREQQIESWVTPGLGLLRSMKLQANAAGAKFVVLVDGLPVNQNISVNEEVVKPIATLAIAFLPRGKVLSASELSKQLEKFEIPVLQFPNDYTAALRSADYLLEDHYHLNESGAALFAEKAYSLLEPILETIDSN